MKPTEFLSFFSLNDERERKRKALAKASTTQPPGGEAEPGAPPLKPDSLYVCTQRWYRSSALRLTIVTFTHTYTLTHSHTDTHPWEWTHERGITCPTDRGRSRINQKCALAKCQLWNNQPARSDWIQSLGWIILSASRQWVLVTSETGPNFQYQFRWKVGFTKSGWNCRELSGCFPLSKTRKNSFELQSNCKVIWWADHRTIGP